MSKICWKGRAFKALSFGKNSKKAGRNFSGNITIFHRGGGSKKLLRRIDFQRKNLARGTIERIEYDPNRTARIALVRWSNIRLNNSVDKYAPAKLDSSSSSLLTSPLDVGTTQVKKMLVVKSPSCLDFSIGEYLLGSGYRNFKTRQRLTPGHQFTNVHGNENRKRLGFTSACFRATTFLAQNVLDSSKKREFGYSTEHPKESVRTEKWRSVRIASELCNDRSELGDEGAQREFLNSQTHSTRNAMYLAEKGSKGCVSYILASEKLMPGDEVLNIDTSLTRKRPLDQGGAEQLYQKSGISLPLLLAPIGSVLHNIELYPGGAGKLARAAGTCAQLVQKPNMSALISRLQTRVQGERYALPETNEALTTGVSLFEDGPKKQLGERKSQEQHTLTRELAPDQEQEPERSGTLRASLCTIRLPSGQHQLLDLRCRATIGSVSNIDHKTRKLKKAGHSRWLGIRPVVRGVAMNPIDHPHGGGEGRTKGGRPSVSPWGKPAKRARRQTLRALRISASSD